MAILLGTSRTTWYRWLKITDSDHQPRWTADQRMRAETLLRIFEAVVDLHRDDNDAHRWLHKSSTAPGLKNRAPLEVMIEGMEGLLLVRDYLNFLHASWS
jgi:uncharacterized protein (DUF2384 family)